MSESLKDGNDFDELIKESIRRNFKEQLESERSKKKEYKVGGASSTTKSYILRVIPYAAAVILMVGALSLWNARPSASEMAFEFLLDTEINYTENLVRGESGSSNIYVRNLRGNPQWLSDYKEHMDTYSNGERLVIAAALMRHEDRLKEADDVLASIQEESSDIKVEKLWLLGLCHAIMNDQRSAAEYLRKLEKISNYKKTERERLLNKL